MEGEWAGGDRTCRLRNSQAATLMLTTVYTWKCTGDSPRPKDSGQGLLPNNLSQEIPRETMETVRAFIFLGSKITADGDCSHEIKRCLLLGRKATINLDSIL